MVAKSHSRGWEIEWNDSQWVYTDSKKPIDVNRPCKRCGRKPTTEGYDACLGHIPNATSACCGHGVIKPFVVFKDRIMTKDQILKEIEEIKKVAAHDDDELAHILEEDLYEEFIEYVAKRKDSLGEKARLILSTGEIDFGRHYS